MSYIQERRDEASNMQAPRYISKAAVISPCTQYRYLLRRSWDNTLPPYVSGMLNPSIANVDIDDPTTTRSVRRAAMLGFGSVVVWNLYAYRATDPSQLRLVADPVGPDNEKWIRHALGECARYSGIAVVGWGSAGPDNPQSILRIHAIAREAGVDLHCLGVTKDGHPRHPLYVSYASIPQLWAVEPTKA
jgi:hypothetical protein